MNRGGVAGRMRVVDIVAVRVAPERVVVARENAGHPGRRGDGMDDGRGVPVWVAHRIEGREGEL